MPLQVSRIRAICFDVDGTLSDTDDVMVAQLAELLKPFQMVFPGRNLTRVARSIVMEAEVPANFLYGIPDLVGLDDETLRPEGLDRAAIKKEIPNHSNLFQAPWRCWKHSANTTHSRW